MDKKVICYKAFLKTFFLLNYCLTFNLALASISNKNKFSLEQIAGSNLFTDFFHHAQIVGENLIDLTNDENGNIWTLGSKSLQCYNGYHWIIYDQSSGLPQEGINCIIHTNEFGLLVGTEKGVFQLKSEKWVRAFFSDQLSGINCLKIIKNEDGEIIFCFAASASKEKPGGITLYKKGKWEQWNKKNGLPTNQVYYLQRAGNGNLYIAGEKDVFKKTPLKWEPIPQMRNVNIRDIVNHPTMGLFFSSYNHYDTKSFLFHQKGDAYPYLESLTDKIKQFMPLSIHPNGDLITVARTPEGQKLFKVVVQNDTIQLVPISSAIPTIGDEVKSILSTTDGAIWIAGNELLVRWKKELPPFTNFKSVTGHPRIVSKNEVWIQDQDRTFSYNLSEHYLEEAQNQKIIGKIGSSEVWLSNEHNLFNVYEPQITIPLENLPITHLNEIYGNEENLVRWIIGTTNKQEVAVVKFLRQTNNQNLEKTFCNSIKLLSSLCDRENQLWLLLKEKTSQKLSIHRFFSDQNSPKKYKIEGTQGNLTLDDNNQLWLFSGNILKIFNRKKNQFDAVTAFPRTSFCKIINYPSAGTLFSFRNNKAWNIAFFDKKKWLFLSEPIVKGPILAVLENKKIILSLPREKEFGILTGFPNNDNPLGLATLPISKNLTLRYDKTKILSNKNSLWFPVHAEGLPNPYIMCWKPDNKPPKTIIENAMPTERIDQNYSLFLRAIPGENSLLNSRNFWFSWQLQNQPWTPYTKLKNNFLTLPKLTSGSYKLKVKSMDIYGNIDPTPADISFKISPIPLQERNWFPYTIAGIIVSMSLLLSTVYRKTFQLKKINQILNHEIFQKQQAQKTVEKANNQLEIKVAERTEALAKINQKLSQTHNALMDASRKAGMTEVATGIIHNVGNVLNSLNIGIIYLQKNIQKSKIAGLDKLAEMIKKHKYQSVFLTQHPKGKHIHEYIEKLSQNAQLENSENLHLLDEAKQHINHIREIVQTQQTFAKTISVPEPIDINQTLHDAAKMNLDKFTRHQIDYQEDFTPLPTILCDRSKIMQIIVNLLQNASDACKKTTQENKKIILRTALEKPDELRISVQDFGIGIPSKNLDKIFNHGFTSKNNGHGFGLHNAANSAKQMDGRLEAMSEGSGTGSTFTLILPLKIAGESIQEIADSKSKRSVSSPTLTITKNRPLKIPLKPK